MARILPRLFVDSANLSVIRHWMERGASGVTTNPSIVAKDLQPGENLLDALKQIVEVAAPHPVSVQVIATDPDEMIKQAHLYRQKLLSVYQNPQRVVVKIPYAAEHGQDYLPIVAELAAEGILVNVTCLMTEEQMLLAIMNGARYVSLFIGRVEESGGRPYPILNSVRALIDREQLPVEIIAGSIRQTDQITKCWDCGRGAHIVTVPANVLAKLGDNTFTVATTKEMVANAAQAGVRL